MSDKILTMFFEPQRWVRAIEKGVGKDIRKDQLIMLCNEKTRLKMADMMMQGKYEISPPHTSKIPKDNGDFRTVYVNEPIDRVVLSIANDLLFELMPEMIHKSCKSYQTGIGCGKVVKEVSKFMVQCANKFPYVGWKADLSKYFDSVPVRYIDAAFDRVEEKHGHSVLIDVLRKYYHCDEAKVSRMVNHFKNDENAYFMVTNSPLTEIHLITGEIGICSLLTGQAGHFEIPRVSYQTSKGNVVLFPDEVMPVDMELLQQQINDGYVLLGDGRYLPPKETVEACYNAFGARVGLLDNWERTYNS